MIKLAANISFLFTELPFLDRFEAAMRAGFTAVEFSFAYDVSPRVIRRRLQEYQLTLAVINTPAGDIQAGELGLGVLQDRGQEAARAFDLALEYACELDARCIHVLAGNRPILSDRRSLDAIFLDYLCHSADLALAANRVLTLEPLNPRDRPHYHLQTNAHAADLIKASGRANVKLQLDLYHCQIAEGNLFCAIDKYVDITGHVQIASVPERAEPSRGGIAYRQVLAHLESLGYKGYVGCEYIPHSDTWSGLQWATGYLGDARVEKN